MRTTIRWAVVTIVVVHGLIHLLGAAKAFGWADVTQLAEPISTALGMAWLAAAVLLTATGVLLAAQRRWWWIVGAVAALVSQAVIVTSWSDAKAGTLANVVLLAAVGYGVLSQGPTGFRTQYRRLATSELAAPKAGAIVTEADLAHLPHPVAAYVRQAGSVGRPRVTNFRARIHGRIRGGPSKPWMTFTGEQVNSYGREPSRLFFMDATMFGLPVDVLHAFVGRTATMRVKLCSLIPMVNAAGPDLERAETVTMFNDLCVLAPAALVDVPVDWHTIDERHVSGAFTNGAHTVNAELTFNDHHELINFVSDDRLHASADGKTFDPQRWSTPISNYRTHDSRRVGATGEARWHTPDASYAYLEFHVDEIAYNVGVVGLGAVPEQTALDAAR
jgi:hypothetical protein